MTTKVSVGFLLSLVIFTSGAMAQRDQIFVGTRPLSMGGAFLAVADDGNAIYWNPAGLARMERIQASFAYANLFGLDIKSYYANFLSRLYFIPPLTDYLTFGVDWFALDAGDEELQFNRDQFNFAIAFKPPKTVPLIRDFSFGMTAKLLKMDAKLDGLPEIDAHGYGWDFGVLYHLEKLPYIPGRFKLGLMVHDGGGTQVTHAKTEASIDQVSETIQHQNIRWGLSYQPFDVWPNKKIPLSDPVIALDFDERVHLGMEFWLAQTLALRAGWQKDFHTDEKPTLSFGLGLKTSLKNWPEANLDYAFTDSPVLPNTNRQFGGSIIFKDDPRLIRIEKAQINNVFASLYLHYEMPSSKLGSLKLKNVSAETLKVWITVQESRFTQPQQADTVMIAPQATIDFSVRAIFKPSILEAPEGRYSAEVKAAYIYGKTPYVSSAPVNFTLHEKSFLTWDDPGKAAAFVTYDHPLVRAFVDEALRKKEDNENASWFSRYSMADALILYDALQAYGFTYRPDPVTPFPSLADTLRGALYRLDKIQYPAEMLSSTKGSGDCDDLAVLYASLLQYAGLGTALVSGPGHIFMMFDTSIPEPESRALPVPPDYFVKRNGTLWIPIETTMLPNASFTEAWSFAATRLNYAAGDTTWKIYEVAANQAQYPPVASRWLPFPRGLPKSIPDFAPGLNRDLTAVEKVKEQYLQAFADSLDHALPESLEIKIRNRYGAILGQNDEYARARMQFQKILSADSAYVPAWHNWGNVEFVLGNFARAETLYAQALVLNSYSRGTYLNLALLYQMMAGSSGDSVHYQQKSEEALLQAAKLLEGDPTSAFAILGFAEERAEGKAESYVDKIKKRIKQVKEFVDKSFKKFVQKREIRGVALQRHGVKRQGELDQDRGEILAWLY